MSGLDLFNMLVESTGLSQTAAKSEVLDLLERHNLNIEDLNISNLREIMADYLQENLPLLKNKVS